MTRAEVAATKLGRVCPFPGGPFVVLVTSRKAAVTETKERLMRPNLIEHWWQNESAQIEERAATAAALREARLSARSGRRRRTRQLLGTFVKPVTVTGTDQNRG